jgi:hypothetical protein
MSNLAEKFNIPPALFEAIKKMNAEETEYQMKVKALMKKKGITSLGQLSPEEKKEFFNTLDAMHKAKNEEVDLDEDINQLDEISPGLAARAASAASDPDYQGRASASNIAKMATKKFGKKIGAQISDVAKGHYPKEYGKDKKTAPLGGWDKLKFRQSRSTSPTMITKSGKLTKTAVKGLKSDLRSEEVDLDEEFAGWIAMYNGQKLEIKKTEAKDLYSAKLKAIAHFKVPKSKQGLVAIKSAYNEEIELDESMSKSPTSLMPGYDERAARFMARQAKGTLVKGSAQSAKQKEGGMKPKKEMKKEEVELDESGGDVVWKKGNDHIEKYGDDKFALYKDGKKTKYYKSIDDAKSALKEEKNGGASKKKENEFHTKLDKLVHKTFGKRPEEMKEQDTSPPFTPDKKPVKKVIPGKYGAGYSTARHLARMAMKKQIQTPTKKEEVEINEMDKSQPSSSRGAEGVPTGKKADLVKTDKVKQDALKLLQKQYKKVKEEVELDEGKSSTGYELYHKDFSSAMAHAYDFAKKKYNIEIDPLEIDRNVAMGPRKPSSGKANAYRLLDKTGKRAIQVQVANLDNKRYELNMYKEEVEEANDPQKSMKRAGLSVARAKEVMRHRKEIGSIRKKRESLRNSFDPVSAVLEAYKKNKMKKEATANDNNKSFKSGEKMSGKTEPIEINPELKEQKS